MVGGGGAEPPPKREELQPHPDQDQKCSSLVRV